ncbi:MAG: hypothetical protein B7Z26_09750, partial [Asticcacaulis sp. 32-58-5]
MSAPLYRDFAPQMDPVQGKVVLITGATGSFGRKMVMTLLRDYDPRKDLSSFRFPTMNLLKVYNTSDRAVDMKEQNDNKE